jgi:hypothetical protein
VRKGRIVSATLSSRRFDQSQAGRVKLNCKFSPKTTHFTYVLTVKKGKKWVVVKTVVKASSLSKFTTTVKKLFAGKPINSGAYRLKLTSDSNSKVVSFRVT